MSLRKINRFYGWPCTARVFRTSVKRKQNGERKDFGAPKPNVSFLLPGGSQVSVLAPAPLTVKRR